MCESALRERKIAEDRNSECPFKDRHVRVPCCWCKEINCSREQITRHYYRGFGVAGKKVFRGKTVRSRRLKHDSRTGGHF